MSLAGTFFMLSVWSSAEPNTGGFDKPAHRTAAHDVLVSLLNAALSAAKEVATPIVFDSDWACRWPRPAAPLDGSVQVEVKLDM